ncbi:MAG: 3-phosphoshikimate 1-carboxyvinyltransferase [Oscillospiraceae bacterium]|nr:3-phosphoshikimate 1-carboxyvinyltransferase [Oscillospiraceae bacterium]
MDITIYPKKLSGTVRAVSSKSVAHRMLICAAFSDGPTELECTDTNQDIEATVGCLQALGAEIVRTDSGYRIIPVTNLPEQAVLDCRESGSTLRFLLPVVCALGVNATIYMSGRLPYRPLSPLWEELERMGAKLSRPTEATICINGQLLPGDYTVSGSVSSQFITGLLLATALIPGQSHITITGKLQSKPYVDITKQVMSVFGIHNDDNIITGCRPFHTPGLVWVEGDWSNAAFFLVAHKLGSCVNVTHLNPDSVQGDRAIVSMLEQSEEFQTVSAGDIPDLVPILAIFFGATSGALITDISRLRLKESDRVDSVSRMMEAFGIQIEATENTLQMSPGKFRSCTIDAAGDHRIAMAAAIGATIADGPVTILGAECVAKSYPKFWQDYKQLGGNYEQYIR